jgi:hypothetical protein
MAFDPKVYLKGQIELGLRRFVADLAAIDEVNRAASPGGIARSPYDLAYELSVVNQGYAARLRGDNSGSSGGLDFHQAPADFQELEKAVASVEAATNAFLAAFEAIPLSKIEEPLVGSKTSAFAMATTVSRHLHYHDAQLNYIQTLLGDGEVHWP